MDIIENKLGVTDISELKQKEEKISKLKALDMFERNLLNDRPSGKFETLAFIHNYLFADVYEFAGKIRNVNISKGNFRFAPLIYLRVALKNIEEMPQSNFEEIVEKYVEMNIAHPFREGNGRSTRIWLDHILKNELGKCIDWSQVDKRDYLMAMERSPVNDLEIKHILSKALSCEVENKNMYMRGLDESYFYEGYNAYKTEDLK